jgi:succinate dehydrogenase / fumarate reductase flavoprotein subunit
MEKYAPNMMELASRDLISQAIASEIILNNNSQKNKNDAKDYVYLDMRHISQETLKNKLPNVAEMIKNFLRKDPSKDLIEIAPSAHYVMGGVPCNVDCEVVDGLFAVGEAACLSVHGANRLGCNSLLDLIVFGKISGEKIALKILQTSKPETQENQDQNHDKIAISIAENKIAKLAKIFEKCQEKNLQEISVPSLKNQLLENNEKCLGVFRNQDNLEFGLQQTKEIYQQLRKIKIKNQQLIFNEELIAYLELENLILNSLAVYFSAINRTESRGAHYRNDFKNRDDKNFLAHSMVKIIDFEQIKMEYFLKPVKNSSLITELNLIPQQRKY